MSDLMHSWTADLQFWMFLWWAVTIESASLSSYVRLSFYDSVLKYFICTIKNQIKSGLCLCPDLSPSLSDTATRWCHKDRGRFGIWCYALVCPDLHDSAMSLSSDLDIQITLLPHLFAQIWCQMPAISRLIEMHKYSWTFMVECGRVAGGTWTHWLIVSRLKKKPEMSSRRKKYTL